MVCQSPQESQRRHQSETSGRRSAVQVVQVQVKRSDRVTLMPFPSQEQFLEKIKVTDMLVGMQHQEPVIQKVTAGAPQVRGLDCFFAQGGRESLSAETNSHQRATTIQMIQKTDEFTDAVQGEGCGCARCDAMTVTAEALRSRLQFLNRVDDVQVVLTMKALVRALSGTVVQGVDGGC